MNEGKRRAVCSIAGDDCSSWMQGEAMLLLEEVAMEGERTYLIQSKEKITRLHIDRT